MIIILHFAAAMPPIITDYDYQIQSGNYHIQSGNYHIQSGYYRIQSDNIATYPAFFQGPWAPSAAL